MDLKGTYFIVCSKMLELVRFTIQMDSVTGLKSLVEMGAELRSNTLREALKITEDLEMIRYLLSLQIDFKVVAMIHFSFN